MRDLTEGIIIPCTCSMLYLTNNNKFQNKIVCRFELLLVNISCFSSLILKTLKVATNLFSLFIINVCYTCKCKTSIWHLTNHRRSNVTHKHLYTPSTVLHARQECLTSCSRSTKPVHMILQPKTKLEKTAANFRIILYSLLAAVLGPQKTNNNPEHSYYIYI